MSPAIAIEQKQTGNTPRSTVGTVTEIYDYLRILVARLGQPYCPRCDVPIGTQSTDEVIAKIMDHAAGTKLFIAARVNPGGRAVLDVVGREIASVGLRTGGVRVRTGKGRGNRAPRKHNVEVVVDRVAIPSGARSRLAGSVETALGPWARG